MTTIHARRPAMRTLFEIVLVGDDPARLRSDVEAALDEIDRVERLLSRFDPAAELFRVNRDGGSGWVRIDRELFDLLRAVLRFRTATRGWFEPCCVPGKGRTLALEGFGWDGDPRARFDDARSAVRFARPEIAFDLGAFGKGYALDRVRDLLLAQGAGDWLLSGGGSSVAASGRQASGAPWRIGVESLSTHERDAASHLAPFDLRDDAASTSAFDAADQAADPVKRLVDPRTGAPLRAPASCTVLHASASQAEVWSTALLAAGRDRAEELFAASRPPAGRSNDSFSPPRGVLWTTLRDGVPHTESLREDRHALADRSA